MTESNIGDDSVDVATLLGALTAAAHEIARKPNQSAEYHAGAADAFAKAEAVVREQAGWPVETEPLIDEL